MWIWKDCLYFFISYIFFFHLQKTGIWKTISKIEKSCSTLTQWKKTSFLLMDAQWTKTPHPNLQHHVFLKVRIFPPPSYWFTVTKVNGNNLREENWEIVKLCAIFLQFYWGFSTKLRKVGMGIQEKFRFEKC